MATRMPILPQQRIQLKNAIYDLQEVYQHAHDWLAWLKYDIWENEYQETITPGGKVIKIFWNCEREIDDYSKFIIEVRFEMFGMTDIEVQQAGERAKMQKGEINAFISAFLETDRQNKWSEKPYLKFMKSFFEKYLYKGQIEVMQGQLWKEGWDFYNELKAFLNLYKY